MPGTLSTASILKFGERIAQENNYLYRAADDLLHTECKVKDSTSTQSIRVKFPQTFVRYGPKIGHIVLSKLMQKVTPLNKTIDVATAEVAYSHIIQGIKRQNPATSLPKPKKFTAGSIWFQPVENRAFTWELTRQPYITREITNLDKPPNFTIPVVREKEEWLLWDNRVWLCIPAISEEMSNACSLEEWVIRPIGPAMRDNPEILGRGFRRHSVTPVQAVPTLPFISARMKHGALKLVGFPSLDLWEIQNILQSGKSVDPTDQIWMKPWRCTSRMELEREKQRKERNWREGILDEESVRTEDGPQYSTLKVSDDMYMNHPSEKGSVIVKPETPPKPQKPTNPEKPIRPKITRYVLLSKPTTTEEWEKQRQYKQKAEKKMLKKSERAMNRVPVNQMQKRLREQVKSIRGKKAPTTPKDGAEELTKSE